MIVQGLVNHHIYLFGSLSLSHIQPCIALPTTPVRAPVLPTTATAALSVPTQTLTRTGQRSRILQSAVASKIASHNATIVSSLIHFAHSPSSLKNYTNAYIRRQETQAPSRGSGETCCFFGIPGAVSCRACTSKGHQQIPPQAARQQIRRCENAAPIARPSSGTTSVLRVLQRS